MGGKIFRTRPDRPWGSPSFLYNGYRVKVKLTLEQAMKAQRGSSDIALLFL